MKKIIKKRLHASIEVDYTFVCIFHILSGEGYTGERRCVGPDTDHDVGSNGEVLDLGIYPTVSVEYSILHISHLRQCIKLNCFCFLCIELKIDWK